MGSLNQDGSKISQSREAVRNVGGSHIVSADRVESEVIRERAPEAASDDLGTNAGLTTSQYSTVSLSEVQKITRADSDEVVSREIDREEFIPDPNHQPREWYGLATASGPGGGGSEDSITISDTLTTNRIIVGDSSNSDIGPDGNIATIIGDSVNKDIELASPSGRIQISWGNGGSFQLGENENETTAALEAEDISLVSINELFLATDSVYISLEEGDQPKIKIESPRYEIIVQSENGSFNVQGVLRGRKHVEVVTMASGEAITLAAASGQVIIVNGSGPRTVNLASSPSAGLIYDVKDGNGTASSGNITVDGNGANIDGESSFVLDVNYASYTFVYNGTEWNLI